MNARTIVTVLGWTNTGKSTLLNRWSGKEVSIVTAKPQTTRWPLLESMKSEDFEHTLSIFDTPGLSDRHDQLAGYMRSGMHHALDQADYVLLLWDANFDPERQKGVKEVNAFIKDRDVPIIVAINKIDLVSKPSLLQTAAALQQAFSPQSIYMISSKKGAGCDDLLKNLWQLPSSDQKNWQDLEDKHSPDLYSRLQEITRRTTLQHLKQEVPYALTVKTISVERRSGSWSVTQEIVTSEPKHRSIIIGRGGRMVGRIGRVARQDMTRQFHRTVHLKLSVVTDKDWLEKEKRSVFR